jgi:hypothetical protein
VSTSLELLAANVAFFVVFSIFVVAFTVMGVITLTWALRRDRAGRSEWLERQVDESASGAGDVPTPRTNGRQPPAGRGGPESKP